MYLLGQCVAMEVDLTVLEVGDLVVSVACIIAICPDESKNKKGETAEPNRFHMNLEVQLCRQSKQL